VLGGNTNTNAAWIASGGSVNRLPAGAIKVTYEISSVSRNASKQPVMKFRMLQNVGPVDPATGKATNVPVPFNVFASATNNPVTLEKEIWDNFAGAPSVYFVYAVPQDGIQRPAEFNASSSIYLRTLWKGTSSGTLTGPDTSGWYTATITNVAIPDSASMLTGGLGYSYNVKSTLPLTQTNLTDYPAVKSTVPTGSLSTQLTTGMPNITGGLIVIAPNVQKVASAGCPTANNDATQCVLTGSSAGAYIARRPIVEDARCNACHQELGTFTEDAFHAGQRNDGTTCSWCHTPNRTSSAWSADSTSFVHAIHAGAKRADKYTWHAASTTEGFWDITYPGVLNQCETCHLPNTYDFSASASASVVDNRLYRTVGQGYYVGTVGALIPSFSYSSTAVPPGCVKPDIGYSAQTDVGVFAINQYANYGPVAANGSVDGTTNVTSGTNYGAGFSYNAGTAAAGSNQCKPDGTAYNIPAGGTYPADPTTLVTSPTVTVCIACHDSSQAVAHFKINAASVYEPRSTALSKPETCLVCHGQGRIGDISVMHAK
jgi:OmcA/MtrC family decaheme c-type cytochrome